MKKPEMHPDDPRLTAFALGELPPAEAAEVAAAVDRDPALAAEVAAIQSLSSELASVLEAEPLPETVPVEVGERVEFPLGRRTEKRFPYYWVSGLAAAGFAILVVVQSPESPLVGREDTRPIERGDERPPVASYPMAAEPNTGTITLELTDPSGLAAAKTEVAADDQTGNSPEIGRLSQSRAVAIEKLQTAPGAPAGADLGLMRTKASARAAAVVPAPEFEEVPAEIAAGEDAGWRQVIDQPRSTFGLEVDPLSYGNVRHHLLTGSLPPVEAVKVEELVNAFAYDYSTPHAAADAPLRANLEVAAAPWAPEHRLVRIGLRARDVPSVEREAANLVFLLEGSGSGGSPQRVFQFTHAIRGLMEQMGPADRLAIVTSADTSQVALPSTAVASRARIHAALRKLRPGESPAGTTGLSLAYATAEANFVPGGINRVILCREGGVPLGSAERLAYETGVARGAETGISLSTLDMSFGGSPEPFLVQLAHRGNGQHAVMAAPREVRRWLAEQLDAPLPTVARAVKIQVEFNPDQVTSYRLIGYSKRRLAPLEFDDAVIEVGEILAGHAVTALYEIVPAGPATSAADPGETERSLGARSNPNQTGWSDALLRVELEAQPPTGGASRGWVFPLEDAGRPFAAATPDFQFAAAVAGFGLRLRDDAAMAGISFAQVETWAHRGAEQDPDGHRREFLELVRRAADLSKL